MKKICFAFNHLQYSDGIARAAIGISNYLVANYDIEVELHPIFKCDNNVLKIIDKKVKVSPVFGFFFPGLSKLIKKMPKHYLHNRVFGKGVFDIEVGFQHGTSTVAVTSDSRHPDIKHYVWMHGYDVGLTMLKYFRKADKVVCVSKSNAERLYNESNGEICPEYSYNLIDEKKVIKDGQEAIEIPNSGKKIFVSVGRHSEEKGYKRLLECVEKLKRDGYSFELWLVGDGPEHQSLIALAHNLKLDTYVRFVGNQSNPHKYTSKSDLFICSSYSEGYSTACTEAIMLGIPVLTTNVSGAEEIINSAEAGLVVENNDDALYEGMKRVLDDEDLILNWKTTITDTKVRFSQEWRAKKLITILGLDTM